MRVPEGVDAETDDEIEFLEYEDQRKIV
jgi:hypothetical protein